ncbi:MAG: four helix bundle protein [Nitrospiraceae bacterium]
MFRFEKLDVWQKAVEYADFIYGITQSFPVDERFGLTSQLRRSAVSVSSNIAEGTSRSSQADLGRFIELAYGSLLESVSELQIAKRQRFLDDGSFEKAYNRAETLAKMLSGLRRTLKRARL